MQIVSVNITSVVHEGEWTGSEGKTGIDKRAALGPIRFANQEVVGDVIVDRNHPNFPMSADYVGYSLSTTLNEHIQVVLSDKEKTGVYIY